MSITFNNTNLAKEPKSAQIGPSDRAAFWGFCMRTAIRTRKAKGLAAGDLTPHDIDKLFVDQGWCCAVSGMRFEPPRGQRQPFGPSIDRIAAGGRYEIGNVRIVCNIVNMAMNRWGEEALRQLVSHMAGSEIEL